MKRKICIVTGTRAEYGVLYWLMKDIRADRSLILQLVVTGAHLAPEHGSTYRVIETDGFPIDAKIEMLLSSDTPFGIAKSMGVATLGFADAFARLRPDLLVLIGDRYEILAAAQTALVAGIPVAHIAGGEVTEGAIDDSIRHAVTKMAHLHFTAAEAYRKRVIQLGEDPRRVFNVGNPCIDSICRLKLLPREEWSRRTGFRLCSANVTVTFHPATTEAQAPGRQFREVLKALESLPEDTSIVFTRPGADAGGHEINELIDDFVARCPTQSAAFKSLGQLLYLSLLKNSIMMVGNSSSGITEAPAMGIPTVNVGDRQKGRLMAASVFNCRPRAMDVMAAMRRASVSSRHVSANPYGGPGVSGRMLKILKHVDLAGIQKKRFFDSPR
jgi:UDP-hydrolysing UDP-N-acetyl-D-glucosamine 2-epimerase